MAGGLEAVHGKTENGAAFSAVEQRVLDVALAAVAASEAGFDDEGLTAIRDALLAVVPFDRIAILIDDHPREGFRVLWRSSVKPGTTPVVPMRERLAYDAQMGPPPEQEARVVEDVRQGRTRFDAPLLASGLKSYVLVPLAQVGTSVGWLVIAHEAVGAPSQRALPLLLALGRTLAPAVTRARVAARYRLLAALVEESPDGMLALDRHLTVNEVNAAAERLLGRGRADVIGRALAEVIGEGASQVVAQAVAAGGPQIQPIELSTAEGRVPIDAVVAPITGTTEGSVQVHLRDARARRAAEETTARRVEQLAFLRALGEAMASDLRADKSLARAVDLCFVRFELGALCALRVNVDGSLRLVASHGAGPVLREKLARSTEVELEALLSMGARITARTDRLVEAGGVRLPDDPHDGAPRWLRLAALVHARRRLGALVVVGHAGDPMQGADRQIWESVANTISVALHAADDYERVVALEAEKRQLVDNLPVVVARLDPKTGATLFANGAVKRVLGIRVADVMGVPGLEGMLADPIEREAAAAARLRASRGQDASWQDRRYRHQDGRPLTLREHVYPVFEANGAIRAVEVIAYDVTTEIESRKQLMQADRLASLGALAAGIAHEINNPVAFIGLAAGQVGRLLDRESGQADVHDKLRELARELGEAATRIADIVGELKLFTRMSDAVPATPIDINRILQAALTLTSAELRRRARLEIALGELPLVPGSFGLVGQAFVNLLLNAAQAVDSEAQAGADTAKAAGEPHVVRVTSEVKEDAIVVCVSDDGVGIPPQLLPRIFDPFFTTKASGQGSGLGLAISYDLVRRVGGDIRVRSAPGSGTTFEVILPLEVAATDDQPGSAGRLRAARALGEPPEVERVEQRSRGRVLIIDDEVALVKALARQLSDRFEVDTASTASDALARLGAKGYDVVVCDLRMPDQSGPAIYDAVLARAPAQAARFIFTSGGSYGASDDELHARAGLTGRPVLEKPFDGASFESLVAEVAAPPQASDRAST